MTGGLHETIAALSTPPGESGIAVVRLSGPTALDIAGAVFHTRQRTGHAPFEHRRLYHGHIVDGGEPVDDVVCAVMRGPDSYTGEDTVEISCHGNTMLVERILGVLFQRGARAAEAGEFTKRAFLNGKMDLIQAEAVADLIHARSELQRRVAQRQLAGTLSDTINALAEELLELLGFVEANIDFIEDDIDTLDVPRWLEVLDRHVAALAGLLEDSAFSRPFRHGYRVLIAGPVNAGKSSLFNRIVGENRAIVTDVPGTTRDLLREPVVVEGLLFVLQDSAGLRGTEDRVERIGVGMAESALADADIVLFVTDATAPWSDDITERLRALDPDRAVLLVNKTDLAPAVTGDVPPGMPVLSVSAKTGDGMADVTRSLIECVGRERLNWIARERVVLNSRLVSTLRETRTRLGTLRDRLAGGAPLEILAVDARDALALYQSATGRRYTDDLLDTIFSRFCIGK